MARVQASLLLLLLAMTGILFFAGLDHPLLEPEEARYAEIPRQMLVEGRFLTPVLHGEDYWQKPPLLYWLVMLSYQLFGVHDWAARLIPGLAAILTVAVTTWWAWRVLGFWTGFVSGAILALSVRFLYLAGMLTMDGLLCTCVLAGLACGHLGLIEPPRRWRWTILSALAAALGILTKGPVALVLILAPLIALALLDRGTTGSASEGAQKIPRWRVGLVCNRFCVLYLGIVALVAGPWFVVMACHAPQAAGTFFWLHHLVRYLAPFDHEKPAWFYLPSLLLGMMPWTLLLIPMIPYLCRQAPRARRRRPPALSVFVLGFTWCVLFFSASGCKRPGYVLPAFPLLALLLGTFVTHGLPWRHWLRSAAPGGHLWARRLTLATCAMGMAIAGAAALGGLWSWPTAAVTTVVFAILSMFPSPRRFPTWTSWAGCATLVFVMLGFGQRALSPVYHERFGLRRQVEDASEYEQEEPLPMVSYPRRWDSISFYSQRNDVESYTFAEKEKLTHSLRTHGKALIFVPREVSLQGLSSVLPAGMEIEMRAPQGSPIGVGLVRLMSPGKQNSPLTTPHHP